MIELELGNKEDLLAKGREKQAHGQTGPGKTLLSENDKSVAEKPEPPPHRTRETIAKAAGVSTGQVGMAEQVRKKAPDLWDKAKSVREAARQIADAVGVPASTIRNFQFGKFADLDKTQKASAEHATDFEVRI